jgi:hypothetical protein
MVIPKPPLSIRLKMYMKFDTLHPEMYVFSEPIEFEWDTANRDKNWHTHQVASTEAEDIFFDQSRRQFPDPIHSTGEVRHLIIGQTREKRVLVVAFTIRNTKLRVISARDANKQEKHFYEKTP